uniref:Catalase core domain-containing protein n=1 Tax=Myotis myotis TaxID=51298 RepID=A0A7J7Z4J3_MYOMY|nr:hypothetical protein mMyoMyo1_010580 [Myotis myotis]
MHTKGAGAFGYFEITYNITKYSKAKVFEHIGKSLIATWPGTSGACGPSLCIVFFLFSDRGIPDGHRHMNGYGSHTFKLVNAKGEDVYCKFHYKTDQGIKNLLVEDAARLSHEDPDYGLQGLFNAIATGNYPSWTFYIQVMTFSQAESSPFTPFNVTKIWPHKDYPLIPVGKLVLNRNPVNYFAEVEQLVRPEQHAAWH